MHPVLLHIGSIKLYTYGLFVALGFMTAVWVSQKNARSHGMDAQAVTDVFFVILASAIVGARLLYVGINFESYARHPLDILKIWNGGLVFFGGFCSAVGATAVYLKIKKFNLWQTADVISPGIALGHAVGRIGCFFAGCCYGKACDLPWAIRFNNPETLAPMGVFLHPTQLYSVFSNLILFGLLVWLQRRKTFDGMVFLSYILVYSMFRAFIEFFRGDFRGDFFFNFLSMSQGIGLVVSLAALVLLIKLSRSSHGAD